ncbi:SRPBCC family protein [Mariniflexile ostreae]|uniref:SRPBCC family protein n=1 Tax=Mariniflexile ostreae TaxID=1520892 RepID=A0ABV5FE64_9FLAO
MKALKYVFFLLLIIIIGLTIYIAVQPNSYEVTKTRTIKAPATVIYDHVIDFKNWESWPVWSTEDTDIQITYPEKTKGIDASYSWKSSTGTGTVNTIETTPNSSINQHILYSEFPKSDIDWSFTPNADGSTDVSWTFSSKNLPFKFKAFSILSGSMEERFGINFDQSLERLEREVLADMKKYSIEIDGVTQYSGGFYIYTTMSCKISQLETEIQKLLQKLSSYATQNNIKMAGAPFVKYHNWDDANNAVMFSFCIPTTDRVITTENDLLTGQIMPFKAVKATLHGDYSNLKEAWRKTMAYLPNNGLILAEEGPMLETYPTDPRNTPNPADLVTHLYIAIQE